MQWCEKISDEEDIIIKNKYSSLCQMINLFYRNKTIIQKDDGQAGDISDIFYRTRVHNNLLRIDEKYDLPIAVFSYITPTISKYFILHIMLSMGRFETEMGLLLNGSIREYLRY